MERATIEVNAPVNSGFHAGSNRQPGVKMKRPVVYMLAERKIHLVTQFTGTGPLVRIAGGQNKADTRRECRPLLCFRPHLKAVVQHNVAKILDLRGWLTRGMLENLAKRNTV